MSEPENRQNEQYSDSDPWIKNERRVESEPGKKERVPSSGFLGSIYMGVGELPLVHFLPDKWTASDLHLSTQL